MIINGHSLIGYQEHTGEGKGAKALNPATGESLEPTFVHASAIEVDRAAQLAHSAFLDYSQSDGASKARFLEAIASEIEALGDSLTERAMLETGLPEARIKGETTRATGQLRLFAALVKEGSWVQARIDTAIPNRQPLPKPDLRSMLRPLGPVAVFAASNFPLAFSVAGGDTASALAAGCPVIVKAHSSHPGTSALVGQAIKKAAQDCGMPEGVFSLIFGSGREAGVALVQHPRIKAVGFTGSTSGGTSLMKLAAARPEPIPVYAEMGSVNPVFILPGALAERGEAIAQGLHVSATMGVGQFCTNPGVVMLEENDAGDAFKDTFAGLMKGHPDEVMLNGSIQQAYNDGVSARQNNDNVQVVVSREGSESNGSCLAAPAVFEAQASQYLMDESLASEIFGPGTTLVRYSSRDDLLRLAENMEGQLTATVHGADAEIEAYADLISVLERKAGRVVYNAFPTGVEVCHSIVHGGPFPATSDGRSTSVGTHAIERFVRLVAYQGSPQNLLPKELQDSNPTGILRLVDGEWTKE